MLNLMFSLAGAFSEAVKAKASSTVSVSLAAKFGKSMVPSVMVMSGCSVERTTETLLTGSSVMLSKVNDRVTDSP